MYKALKISIVIIITLLFVSGVIVLLLQTFISILVYPIGALFLYYTVILFLVTWVKENVGGKVLSIIIWALVLVPIVWLLLAPENLFNLLMPNLNIDMR